MELLIKPLTILGARAAMAPSGATFAQASAAIPAAIVTPDKVESRIGTLDFEDGMPSKDTLSKVYDNLDFTRVRPQPSNARPAP